MNKYLPVVVSLFDGKACGLTALKRAGYTVGKYYAFEIGKYAKFIAMKNHPEIIQCGSVVNFPFCIFYGADLVMGGSPCQGFSIAGEGKGFEDERSKLFFEFLRALKEIKPKYFLLENVKMKKEWVDTISQYVSVEPILINSALVSAQNRNRYYWCNWKVEQPEDRGILLKDIIESDVDEKYYTQSSYFKPRKKSKCVRSSGLKSYDRHEWDSVDDDHVRKLTPVECERLQTLPDNYTEGVSDTQRYKMLGNGWTIDVITHLLEQIPNE